MAGEQRVLEFGLFTHAEGEEGVALQLYFTTPSASMSEPTTIVTAARITKDPNDGLLRILDVLRLSYASRGRGRARVGENNGRSSGTLSHSSPRPQVTRPPRSVAYSIYLQCLMAVVKCRVNCWITILRTQPLVG